MIYTCRDVPADLLRTAPVLNRKVGKRIGTHRRRYINMLCAFDIETTRISRDYSVMYIWQLQLGPEITVIGRSWKEYKILWRRLLEGLPDDIYLVVWVHNLSFEFQFLRGIYDFKSDEVFAVQSRKVLRADMYRHIEYRCSYLHTNMRLETYLAKMGVPDQKLSYDYDKKRWPWTPLSDDEIAYCINDVKGLVEALAVEMVHDGDTLYTIPPTSTGYVRRDVKAAMRRLQYGVIKDMLPDIDTYHLLREAFRGGDTHANRWHAGRILEKVWSWDRCSSYPDVQLNCEFPIGPFRSIDWPEIPWSKLEDLMGRRHKACLIRLALWDVELKDELEGCPYLALDKCRKVSRDARLDNGRILSAGYLETTLTDVDLRIVLDQYQFSARKILTLEHARYGPLPEALKAVIRKYFILKTELTNVPGQELLREKSKNKLNAVYGMSAQSPVKRSLAFAPKSKNSFKEVPATDEELLEEANRKAFFPYQWGVWTTAWARYRLYEGRKVVTYQGGEFVYCDTDSVKYYSPTPIDWEPYNALRRADSIKSGAWADDPKGVRHYMGVYEPDKGYPARFATRGSKKYVVQHPDGKLEATISGVSKREDGGRVSGGMELEAAGGLEAFLRPEFVFREAGGVDLVYNDRDRYMLKVDGHRLKVRECVTINPGEYTLSDTGEYEGLLATAQEMRDYLFDAFGVRLGR